MYADREEIESKQSIQDRLVGDSTGQRRQLAGKRPKQDNPKFWERQLHSVNGPQISKPKVGAQDLRLKLQKKGLQPMPQSVKGSLLGGVRDLREMLSGTMLSHPANKNLVKPKAVPGASNIAKKTAVVKAALPETKKLVNPSSKRKTQQKVDASIDGFLESLDLEKYLITFKAEEVDMTVLIHMTDGDLKALGIPMGPRKKILLALEGKT